MDLWKGHFCQSDDEIVLVFAKMDKGEMKRFFVMIIAVVFTFDIKTEKETQERISRYFLNFVHEGKASSTFIRVAN